MKLIMNKLTAQRNRVSTKLNYLNTWRRFNDFVIRLDVKPPTWEEHASLFAAYLIEERGLQSSSVKSYISAIKRILVDDGYNWDDQAVLLSSLTHACRLINDRVLTRLPIQHGLLELILFEIKRYFSNRQQTYLETMYLAMFALGYYGLMRVAELCESEHSLKAVNTHVGVNKEKNPINALFIKNSWEK